MCCAIDLRDMYAFICCTTFQTANRSVECLSRILFFVVFCLEFPLTCFHRQVAKFMQISETITTKEKAAVVAEMDGKKTAERGEKDNQGSETERKEQTVKEAMGEGRQKEPLSATNEMKEEAAENGSKADVTLSEKKVTLRSVCTHVLKSIDPFS